MLPNNPNLKSFGVITESNKLTANFASSDWETVVNSWGLSSFIANEENVAAGNRPTLSWEEVMDKALNQHKKAWEILSDL